jgi:hypothetical protein
MSADAAFAVHDEATSPFAPGTDVWEFAYPAWSVPLKARAIRSVTLPLSAACVEYLLADGVDIPDDVFHIDQRYVERVARSALHSTRACPPFLPAFARDIHTAIASLGGAVFPKLSWSSPKDARWITLDGSLRCENARDVLALVKASATCATDLLHHPARPVMASARGWGPAPALSSAAPDSAPAGAGADSITTGADSDSTVIYDESHPDYDPLRALLARAKQKQAADAATADAAAAAAAATSGAGAATPHPETAAAAEEARLTAEYGPDARTLVQRLGPLLPPPPRPLPPATTATSAVVSAAGPEAGAEGEPAAVASGPDAATPFALVLKKWSVLQPWREFRVFVVHRHVVAISQRDDDEYDELQRRAVRRRLKNAVLDFHDDCVAEKRVFRSPHYCYDVYVDSKGKVFVVDASAVGPDVGATALVDWDRHLGALIAAGEADAAAAVSADAPAAAAAAAAGSNKPVSETVATAQTLGEEFFGLVAKMSELEPGKEADVTVLATASAQKQQQPVVIPGINDDEDDSDFETEDRGGRAVLAAARRGFRYPVPLCVVTAETARSANQRATVAAVKARLPADRCDLTDTDAIEKMIAEQKAAGNFWRAGDETSSDDDE